MENPLGVCYSARCLWHFSTPRANVRDSTCLRAKPAPSRCLVDLLYIFSARDGVQPWGKGAHRSFAQGSGMKQMIGRLGGKREGQGRLQRSVVYVGNELFSSPALTCIPALVFPWGISSDNSTQVVKEVVQRGEKSFPVLFPHQNLNIFWRGKKKIAKDINKSLLSANPLVGVGEVWLKCSCVTHFWAALCRQWKLVLSRFYVIF